jgi:excisionase family DNA binding protein
MSERLLKVADVMRMLNVSRGWVYEAAADGRIPHVRLGGPGGPLRFVREDLEAWLENARRAWRPADTGAATLRRAQEETTIPS